MLFTKIYFNQRIAYYEKNLHNVCGHFESIGTVQAANAPDLSHNYSFLDRQPLAGKNYYQLKQVDKDGKSKVYKIISVEGGQQTQSMRLVTLGDAEIGIAIQTKEQGNGRIIYTDIQGSVLYNQSTTLRQGENIIRIPFVGISKRMGVISFINARAEKMKLKSSQVKNWPVCIWSNKMIETG